MPTASPRSNSMVISVTSSFASIGLIVRCQTISSGASHGSSRIFPSERRVQKVRVDAERRLAALVLGDRDLVLLGELRSARCATVSSHSRQGAMILMSGFSA